MTITDVIKLYSMFGITLAGTISCASSRDGITTNNDNISSTDTMRVAHVRYTPERDYINLEKIKNGHPTEQYTEITASPESETTLFGDTILIQNNQIINISAKRRTHQK